MIRKQVSKGVTNDRTNIIPTHSNFGCYCDMVFLSRCFMNPKAIRHIIGWSGLIATVSFVAGFMSFFINLSGYDINIRWIVIPCVALTLFLSQKQRNG